MVVVVKNTPIQCPALTGAHVSRLGQVSAGARARGRYQQLRSDSNDDISRTEGPIWTKQKLFQKGRFPASNSAAFNGRRPFANELYDGEERAHGTTRFLNGFRLLLTADETPCRKLMRRLIAGEIQTRG